ARSRCAIAGRSGTPVTRASRNAGTCSVWYGKPTATLRVKRIPILLATPGGTFTSWITIGVCRRHAARYAGTDTYPPKPTTTSAATSSSTARVARDARHIRSGVRTRFMFNDRGNWYAEIGRAHV